MVQEGSYTALLTSRRQVVHLTIQGPVRALLKQENMCILATTQVTDLL